MDGIKRFVTCHVPVFSCNFKCKYCYVHQLNINETKIQDFFLPPCELAEKLTIEKMGGICYFNLSAFGETMLHPQIIDLVFYITLNGHYVDIITNGTISRKFDQLISRLSDKQKKLVFIKFSFHWLELERTNMMQRFLDNVGKIKKSLISYTIEITPHDSLVPYIEEIKKFSLKHFGALPHVTVARDESTKEIKLLTDYGKEQYREIWSTFNSQLFDFKISIFNKKRKEFCYAGDWSIDVDLATGVYKQCYKGCVLGNIKNDEKLNFIACGKCRLPHCFNGHAFLALGNIPVIKTPTYAEERDRTTINGEHWLNKNCSLFFGSNLKSSNKQLSFWNQKISILLTYLHLLKDKFITLFVAH